MNIGRTWSAKWIWGGEEDRPRNEWRCFRKSFECPENGLKEAVLHISADSRYVLYVNGTQAGRGPVRSWPEEQSYDSYDVAHLLLPGRRNTIAVLVLHFGMSNFYYLLGQGALITELEGPSGVLLATDDSWGTSRLPGQQSSAPRMSCQQAFGEVIDARELPEHWTTDETAEGFQASGMGWEAARQVAAAGEGPWKKLVPRDIPFLTEEKVYPSAVISLCEVQPPAYAAAFDLKTIMLPESVWSANPIAYKAFLSVQVNVEKSCTFTIGFPTGAEGAVFLDGKKAVRSYGVEPERYDVFETSAGSHLVLIETESRYDHGSSWHLGFHADAPFTLSRPELASTALSGSATGTNADGNPFALIGPFATAERTQHWLDSPPLPDHPLYIQLREGVSPESLPELESWVKPLDTRLYTDQDVFGSSVWQTATRALAVPAQLQQMVVPAPEPAVLPGLAGDCEFVVDLGEQRSGYIGFELEAAAGTILDVYGIEHMEGDYRQHTYGLDNTISYICRDGRQSYLSPVRRGCRYLIVTVRQASAPVKLYEMYMNQSSYPLPQRGEFRCSDSLLNEIWQISRRTTKLCMEDTFVDCPAYEQTFWVGDARNEALVNYYVFGATDIVKRCLNLVPGSESRNPLYLDQVPSGWNSVIPNWTFFWMIACQEYVEHTDDSDYAKTIWPSVQSALEAYYEYIDDKGLLNIRSWNLLDWAPIDQPNSGVVTHQNLFFMKAMRLSAALAQRAGQSEQVSLWQERSEVLRTAINLHLWDEERQAFLDCIHEDGRRSEKFSVQTQVIACLCAVADGERKASIESHVLQPPVGWTQIGSPFMSFFYYEVLASLGRSDLLVDDIRLQYGRMLDHGATTCWEMYPSFKENRASSDMLTRSHCHAWSAAPGYFLGREILGVRPLDTGWRKVEIAPEPAGLRWASGAVPLPEQGEIKVAWSMNGDNMKLTVTAPEGIELDFKWPEGVKGSLEVKRVFLL
ncbi:family 78 glycoside hydrolase catalytic domain [Paenibacillus herberti]|uniref:Alpha-L-rhamnosidase n=1 Tax=Paenibacillus herberti TaxID=1619309 RepID=A0A229P3T1_9BACL|nr:family 78 glycoside hydrolase catalytic domain [Paenibacillus herberti]OXM16565.1 alpha-L-rhamnosidase [Paenibacillus herberti]